MEERLYLKFIFFETLTSRVYKDFSPRCFQRNRPDPSCRKYSYWMLAAIMILFAPFLKLLENFRNNILN